MGRTSNPKNARFNNICQLLNFSQNGGTRLFLRPLWSVMEKIAQYRYHFNVFIPATLLNTYKKQTS